MFIGVMAAVIFSIGFAQPTYAHFAVKDAETGVKAIFHVTPDHDPIAGEESVISFDFAKTETHANNFTYVLTVKSTKSEAVTLPLEVAGNVVLTSYAFPNQGFYTITLTAIRRDDGVVSKLQYGQRVSRGEIIEQNKGFGVFETGAIIGVTLIGIGAIIFSLRNDSKKRRG